MKINNLAPTANRMDMTPAPRLLQVLQHLDVDPWACVAEFIDNSLDDFKKHDNPLGKIELFLENETLNIIDNGAGMSFSQLENALRAGYSNKSKTDDLGLFGIGFNVACAKLGRKATVFTKRENDTKWLQVSIDIDALIKSNSFQVQPYEVDLDLKHKSGTIVQVSLTKLFVREFERPGFIKALSKKLGQIYSYLLRKHVPGLTGPCQGNPRNVEIILAKEKIVPILPCIWDENRDVTYKGSTIKAIQKFEKKLSDVAVCENCGHKHLPTVLECNECESKNLKIIERKVWGWVGVQRFLSKLDFGIDFIRNGRVIVKSDQSIFTFEDSTTGEIFKDYPVEWPADEGRIVGEIHCDHVGVDFIKQSFDKNDPNWRGVLEIVRGDTSLQPKRAKGVNNSPLAQIFNAYRINEPGLRYLIPGNGTKAINRTAEQWSEQFYNGDQDYQSDQKWYDAAATHDNKCQPTSSVAQTTSSPSSSSNPTSNNKPTLSPINANPVSISTPGSISPINSPGPNQGITSSNPTKIETLNDKMTRWKKGGYQRKDLPNKITIAGISETFNIEAWETNSHLDNNGRPVHIISIPTKGKDISVFVDRNCKLTKTYGRNLLDLILIELSNQLTVLGSTSLTPSEIYQNLLELLPDEEKSERSSRNRLHELLQRLRSKIVTATKKNPSLWDKLSGDEQLKAEEESVGSGDIVVWSMAINNGDFGKYINFDGLKSLVDAAPEDFFDGKIFKQYYATHHAPAARRRSQGYISDALKALSEISAITGALNPHEIKISDVAINFINESLVDDVE